MPWWTTKDEKEFIDNIGNHRTLDQTGKKITKVIGIRERATLLGKYARSVANRVNWGEVNKQEIEVYIKEKIREIKNQPH